MVEGLEQGHRHNRATHAHLEERPQGQGGRQPVGLPCQPIRLCRAEDAVPETCHRCIQLHPQAPSALLNCGGAAAAWGRPSAGRARNSWQQDEFLCVPMRLQNPAHECPVTSRGACALCMPMDTQLLLAHQPVCSASTPPYNTVRLVSTGKSNAEMHRLKAGCHHTTECAHTHDQSHHHNSLHSLTTPIYLQSQLTRLMRRPNRIWAQQTVRPAILTSMVPRIPHKSGPTGAHLLQLPAHWQPV